MAGMNAADREIARELRQRLAQGVKIEDFRVFGSRVRGDATPESDLDVYLIL
jgi:predicted nucleotidyltransferase